MDEIDNCPPTDPLQSPPETSSPMENRSPSTASTSTSAKLLSQEPQRQELEIDIDKMDDKQLKGLYKKSSKHTKSNNKIFGGKKNPDAVSTSGNSPVKNNSAKNYGNNQQQPFQTQSLSMLVTINKPHPAEGGKSKPKFSGMSSLLSVIYSLLLIICGVIFPITETLQGVWLNTWYNGLFIFYIYALATVIFIYMQIILLVPSSDCSRRGHRQSSSSVNNYKHETRSVGRAYASSQTSRHVYHDSSKKFEKEAEDGDELGNKLATQYEISENGGVKKKPKVLYSSSFEVNRPKPNKQLITAVLKFNSTTRLNGGSTNISKSTLPRADDDDISETVKRHNSMLEEIPTVDEVTLDEEEITEEVFIDLSELGNIFSHNGSSFFLRIGTLIFGVGHIIYIILEIQQTWVGKQGCERSRFWWVFIWRLIFVVVQTFVLFKNPAISVRRTQKALFRFAFMHIIATNFCVWIRTLLNEIIIEANYISKYSNYTSNTTTTQFYVPAITSNCTSGGILQIAAPYLFPFVMEYSLLSISVAAVMYWSISEDSRDNVEKGITNLFKIDVFEKDSLEDIEKEKRKEKKLNDHRPHGLSESEELFSKSHRGIYTGFMLLTGIIVCIVFYNFSYGSLNEPLKGEAISLASELIITILILFVALGAFYQMRNLSFINKPGSIDDYLLMIAMFGGLMYLLCIIMSGFNAFTEGIYRSFTLETLRIIVSFFGIAQLIIQVVLITSGLRHYPSKQSHVIRKPGRGSLTFLVIANVSAWIFHSVLTKSHDLQYSPTNLFGKVPWIIMINVTVPLLLFFYFHSSVCLADIWHQAYVPLQSNVNKPHLSHGENIGSNSTSQHLHPYNADDVFGGNSPMVKSIRSVQGEGCYQQKTKSVLSFLSPLIRSISVSQLNQGKNTPNIIIQKSSLDGSLPRMHGNVQATRVSMVSRAPQTSVDNENLGSLDDYQEVIHI